MRKWMAPVLSLLLVVLAGCGGTEAPDSTGGAGEPVTLRVVYSGTTEIEKAWSVKMKELVEAKHPDIKIEYMYIAWGDLEKKLAVMLQAGDIPDLMQVQDATNLVAMNALEPLDSYLERSDAFVKLDDFHTAAVDFFRYDGKLYSLPTAATGYGLIVNDEMLTKAGIKAEDIKTFDDLVNAAKALTKDGVYGFGYASGAPRFSWRDPSMFAYSNGGFTLADVDDAHKQAYLEVLNLYNDLRPYMPEAVTAWQYPDMRKAFANEQIAMMPFGSFFTGNVYEFNPDIVAKAKVIPIPKGPSGDKPAMMVGGVGFAMLAGSKNKDAAWTVLQEFSQKEPVAEFAAAVNLPGRVDVTGDEIAKLAQEIYPKAYEAHGRIIESFSPLLEQYGKTQPRIVGQAEMEVAFQKNMVQLLQGKMTPEEMFENLQREINQIKG